MIDMLKRHEMQVLRRAGHSLPEVAKLAGVSVRSVQRVGAEPAVGHVDNDAERIHRKIGRPSKAEPLRGFVVSLLATEPKLLSLEVLRRARLEGYDGGKSALYELIHSIRPKSVRLMTRFEGLPGEFTQHDFGEVDVYPLFEVGYREICERIYAYLEGFENLHLAGRSGMFRYLNMDRAIEPGMATAQELLKRRTDRGGVTASLIPAVAES